MSEILLLDKKLVRRAFSRAASQYDEVAFLQREVGTRLLERLDVIRMNPRRILDIGAGTGFCTRHLHQRFPQAQVIALDMAQPMLEHAQKQFSFWTRWRQRVQFIVGDAEALPFADASVDMIYSNLTLQWCNELPKVFAEFRRVLAPGGMLMFTTFGPDTLMELRDSWRQVDHNTHVNGFFDMHDIGDAMLRSQLAEPVMDVERLQINYPDVIKLMRDLKQLGAHNVTQQRPRGLTGRKHLQLLQQAYEIFRHNNGLPATYEIIYGHAWTPMRQQKAISASASSAVPHLHFDSGK